MKQDITNNSEFNDILKALNTPDEIFGKEEPVDIDINNIDNLSGQESQEIIDSIIKLYDNNHFIAENPNIQCRIKSEIDSIRLLVKMRKLDEVTHDIIIQAISKTPSNASLYRSLTEIQRTILSISAKIDENIKNIVSLLKGYQLEFDFNKKNSNSNDNDNDNNTFRGSKDFILNIKKNLQTTEEINF